MSLPYKVEYVRSGGPVNCSKCTTRIIPGRMRFAEMVQAKSRDEKFPVWFHKYCFFNSHQVKSQDDIEKFEELKYENQIEVIKKINPGSNIDEIARKITAINLPKASDLERFHVDYSPSDYYKCWNCDEKIAFGSIRIKSVVYNNISHTDVAAKYGKEVMWTHLKCFVSSKDKVKFSASGEELPGFDELKPECRTLVSSSLAPEEDDSPNDDNDGEENSSTNSATRKPLADQELFEQNIHKQMSELFRVRSGLRKDLTKEEMNILLTYNDCKEIDNVSKALNRCADIVTFGALEKCQKCRKGEMMYTKRGYACNEMVDEWKKCGNLDVKPLRKPCVIPEALKKKTFFAKAYEVQVEDRILRPVRETRQRSLARDSTSQNPSSSTSKKVVNVYLKKGNVVDRRSKLDRTTHLYKYRRTLFSSTLGLTDIEKDKNSYFKLQVLESDASTSEDKRSYWLFTSWGRIGDDKVGNSKVQPFKSAIEACTEFKKVYKDQTGNSFDEHSSKKNPGKYYPVDINFKNDVKMNTKTPSKLRPELLKLMKLIFDIKLMDKALKLFKLDLERMPLGKLSSKQIDKAEKTLNEIADAIKKKKNEQELTGLSEKFYTLVPHCFGNEKIPIINTYAKVKEKREIVNSLSDIEHAYSIMIRGNDGKLNSFDDYYKKLNANVASINKKSPGYTLIEKYVRNTSVHGFKLQILDVFKICRKGEKERYKKFENANNRMLLWHGSRVTNFASIISKGLTIATASNGGMYGRGIYFADMVSKSANYCGVPKGETGLLVLSEVALGNISTMTSAGSGLVQAPAGFQSVKGVGQTVPDSAHQYKRKDGVIIPLGRPAKTNTPALALNFNEYIVYDEAQVNMQYIVMVKFT